MRADPVTQFVPADEIAGFLGDIEDVIVDVAATLPDHGEFVSRLPPASSGQQAAAAAPPAINFTLRYTRDSDELPAT
jgi:hypothetical protein